MLPKSRSPDKSGTVVLPALQKKARRAKSPAPHREKLFEVEIDGAGRRLSSNGVGGHEHQTIIAGIQVFDHDQHADGNNGISFLQEIVRRNSAGEKYFFVGGTLLDFVAENHSRGLLAG